MYQFHMKSSTEPEIIAGSVHGDYWITEDFLFLKSQGKIYQVPLVEISPRTISETIPTSQGIIEIPLTLVPELQFALENVREIVEHQKILAEFRKLFTEIAPGTSISAKLLKERIHQSLKLEFASENFIDQAIRKIHTYFPLFVYVEEDQKVERTLSKK